MKVVWLQFHEQKDQSFSKILLTVFMHVKLHHVVSTKVGKMGSSLGMLVSLALFAGWIKVLGLHDLMFPPRPIPFYGRKH